MPIEVVVPGCKLSDGSTGTQADVVARKSILPLMKRLLVEVSISEYDATLPPIAERPAPFKKTTSVRAVSLKNVFCSLRLGNIVWVDVCVTPLFSFLEILSLSKNFFPPQGGNFCPNF